MTSPETTLALTNLIYEAATDPSRWQAFLEALTRAMGASRGALLIQDASRPGVRATCWHGWTQEELERYRDRYALNDPWRLGAERQAEGTVRTDADLCPRQEMEASAAFREFYAACGAVHGMGGIILGMNGSIDGGGGGGGGGSGNGGGRQRQSAVSILRGADAGPFGEAHKAILQPLMPHLKRAALLVQELGSLRRQLALFAEHLDRFPHAFLLVDSECRVLYSNALARRAASSGNGFSIANGTFSIASPRQNQDFQQIVLDMAAGRRTRVHRVQIARRSRRTAYHIILTKGENSGELSLEADLPAVGVLVVDVESRSEPDAAILSELFSLTPAEARVTRKLAAGLSAEEIASEIGISIDTVRTHIKRALSKTGTDRQGELISLIVRSVPFWSA